MNKMLIIMLLVVHVSWSQQHVTGNIKAAQNGWHKIMLPAEIRGNADEDLADLRLYDRQQKAVPYIVFEPKNVDEQFVKYQVEKSSVPKKSTTLIVANPKPDISSLALYIANTDVVKKYRISGSNDRQNWYGLVDKDSLSNLRSNSASVVKILQLPYTSYKFIKIDFDDSKSLPINILKAGNFESHTQSRDVLQVPANITFSHVNKKTLVEVSLKNPQHISQLQFDIKGPELYRRNARIFTVETSTHRRKTTASQHTWAQFELSSSSNNAISFPHFKSSKFYIDIQNGDNEPLQINEITVYQTPITIIANLKAAETYTITSGNKKLHKPDYDLSHFADKLPPTLSVAKVTAVQYHSGRSSINGATNFWQQSWFLWLCIALAGSAIAYFSFNLLRDIDNKNN